MDVIADQDCGVQNSKSKLTCRNYYVCERHDFTTTELHKALFVTTPESDHHCEIWLIISSVLKSSFKWQLP